MIIVPVLQFPFFYFDSSVSHIANHHFFETGMLDKTTLASVQRFYVDFYIFFISSDIYFPAE